MPKGTVKHFDNKKGFGFIEQDSGEDDVFIHFSELKGEGFKKLEKGQRVKFDVVKGAKGLNAKNAEVIKDDED